MPFRLAIGSCSCAQGTQSRNLAVRELCSRVLARLERLRSFAPQSLLNLPPLSTEFERIRGQTAQLRTYRQGLSSGKALIVVQIFWPSWRFPNYIGSGGVGHLYAEGMVVTADGEISEAENKLLWAYR